MLQPGEMKILIVEEHTVLRDTMLKLLSDWFPSAAAESADNGTAAVQLLRSNAFTHLVIDLQITDLDAFDVAAFAVKCTPDIRIIATTFLCDEYTVYRVGKLPIRGFVDKRMSTRFNFHQAIANVEVDLAYYSPSFQRLKAECAENQDSFDKILSEREIEVLALLAVPFNDTEIAGKLRIAEGTVEKHRFNILKKLGLNSTTELIRFARSRGIIQPLVSVRPAASVAWTTLQDSRSGSLEKLESPSLFSVGKAG